jgi:hypothetical protein
MRLPTERLPNIPARDQLHAPFSRLTSLAQKRAYVIADPL